MTVRLPQRMQRALHTAALALAIVASAIAPGQASGAPRSVDDRLAKVFARSGLASATGGVVFDVATSRVVYSIHPQRPMIPASNQKLLTAAAALNELGPSHRWTTSLRARGAQSGTTWNGDLYLVGGGDPLLATPEFSQRALWGRGTDVTQLVPPLAIRQIRRVSGDLIVDESYFDSARYVRGWPSRYRFDESPALGALTINQSYLGSRLGGAASRQPDIRSGEVLRRLLADSGIKISGRVRSGTAPAGATTLSSVRSARLHDQLTFMMKTSDNFTAEVILKNLAKERSGLGSTARGARIVTQTLTTMGVPTTGLRVVDGSGLASGNRITATQLAALLNIMHKHPHAANFRAELAISGRRGTLEKRMRAAPFRGRVFAKTGTLRAVSALSGYTVGVDGSEFGFVTLMQTGSITTARRTQDAIAMTLVK